MKRILINSLLACAVALAAVALYAADTETLSEVSISPTADMNAAKLQIVPASFTLSGRHTFSVFKLAPDGSVVDREEITLLLPASREWLNASNRTAALRDIILVRTSLKVNTNVVSATNWVTLTNVVTVTNVVVK